MILYILHHNISLQYKIIWKSIIVYNSNTQKKLNIKKLAYILCIFINA